MTTHDEATQTPNNFNQHYIFEFFFLHVLYSIFDILFYIYLSWIKLSWVWYLNL